MSECERERERCITLGIRAAGVGIVRVNFLHYQSRLSRSLSLSHLSLCSLSLLSLSRSLSLSLSRALSLSLFSLLSSLFSLLSLSLSAGGWVNESERKREEERGGERAGKEAPKTLNPQPCEGKRYSGTPPQKKT